MIEKVFQALIQKHVVMESGPLRSKVISLMKEKGQQSVKDLETNLGISNGSSRSILIKLHQAGKIERVGPGVYQLKAKN